MFTCAACGKSVDKVYEARVLNVPVKPGWCTECMKYELGIDVDATNMAPVVLVDNENQAVRECCDHIYESYCQCCAGECQNCSQKCRVCGGEGFYEEGAFLYCEDHVPSTYWDADDPRSQQPNPGVNPLPVLPE